MSEPGNPFAIDYARLDRECLEQAKHSRAAGVREADARHAHSQAKARLEVVSARLLLAIRAAPVAYKLREKPNEAEIEAAVVLQPEYTQALAELNQAEYEVNIARTDTAAYIDRRKMIERLVDLIALDWTAEREPKPRTAEGAERLAAHRTRTSVGGGIEYDRNASEPD